MANEKHNNLFKRFLKNYLNIYVYIPISVCGNNRTKYFFYSLSFQSVCSCINSIVLFIYILWLDSSKFKKMYLSLETKPEPTGSTLKCWIALEALNVMAWMTIEMHHLPKEPEKLSRSSLPMGVWCDEANEMRNFKGNALLLATKRAK